MHEGLLRCWRSCRLRWTKIPDLKSGGFTDHEEGRIVGFHSQLAILQYCLVQKEKLAILQ